MPRAQEVLPKYLQIANSIRDEILDGKLSAGDEIRSERELAAQWSVARPTAAKALAELRRLGLAESLRGSGTFVVGQPVAHRAAERFRSSKTSGVVYAPFEHAEILAAEVVDAPEEVRVGLDLEPGSQVIRRLRRTLEGERVNEMSTSWFDAALTSTAARLLSTDRIRQGTTAYVEESTGRVATIAEDRESARKATSDEVTVLGIARGSAVLVTEHRVLDALGHPLEWAQSVCPAGRWTPVRRYRVRP